MSKQQASEYNLALFIDGDNISHKKSAQIIHEVRNDWIVSCCHVYGNSNTLENWKKSLEKVLEKDIIETYSVEGKNAADSRLTINATKILLSKTYQGIGIVSSDVDFAELCEEGSNSGLFVIGIGEEKAPQALVNKCHKFIYISHQEEPKPITPSPKSPNHAVSLIQQALVKHQNPPEWVHLGVLGIIIKELYPNFQSSNYGHNNLLTLIESLPNHFVIGKKNDVVYVSLVKNT